jgi:hypothetical protein
MSLPKQSNSRDVLIAGNCLLYISTDFFLLLPAGNGEGLVILLLFFRDACSVESKLCCSLDPFVSVRGKLTN